MRKILFLTMLLLGLAACSSLPIPGQVSPTPEAAATATMEPTATPLPTPTATSLPPLLVLLLPTEADAELADELQAYFSQAAQQAGLRWQVRQSIDVQEVRDEVDYLVAVPPAEGVAQLVAAAPETRFLAVGIPGLEPSPNLLAVGTEADRPDQKGFIAGYVAAMLTDYWRVGVISVEDTEAGQAARIGFQNGVYYFCGLCRSGVPPFYDYPLFIGLPAGASDQEWRQVGSFLLDRLVETVYVAPGAGGDDLILYLAGAGVRVIGSSPPPSGVAEQWVASVRQPDLANLYLEYWPRLLAGEGGQNHPLPIVLADTNETNLSVGKEQAAGEILSEMLAGFIDPGATPIAPIQE